MRKLIYLTILAGLAFLLILKPGVRPANEPEELDLLIKLRSVRSSEKVRAILLKLQTEVKVITIQAMNKRSKESANWRVLLSTNDSRGLVDALHNQPNIAYIEHNVMARHGGFKGTSMPDDKLSNRQWAIFNDGRFSLASAKAGADLKMPEAWQLSKGDTSIIVAILDGGCSMFDPDFAGRLWRNKKEIPFNGIDDDDNGYKDDILGWDFVREDNFPEDREGHGTNVASIIGANANNGIGYTGLDWRCRLMILKIVDDAGEGAYSDWAEAIYYAVDNGARVINLSVGGVRKSRMLQEAIDYAHKKNVVVVASMMNTDSEIPYYPAACNHVLAVGATNPNDQRSKPFFWSRMSGSNFGKHLDVVAPGNFIYGIAPDGYDQYWGGTSQASPHVSGLSALLLAQNPKRTPDDIYNIITRTADDRVGLPHEDKKGWDKYYGYGRINAYRALKYGHEKGM